MVVLNLSKYTVVEKKVFFWIYFDQVLAVYVVASSQISSSVSSDLLIVVISSLSPVKGLSTSFDKSEEKSMTPLSDKTNNALESGKKGESSTIAFLTSISRLDLDSAFVACFKNILFVTVCMN